MSDARSTILNGIRRSLHRGELSGAERQAAEDRLAEPPRGPAVARANLPQPDKVALFAMGRGQQCTVARVAAADVSGEVANYLARNNLPAEAAMAPGPALDGFDWASRKMLSLRRGRGEGSDCLDHRRLRRHRRDRHAGDGIGAGASGDAQPPARNAVVILREADVVGG